MLHFVQNEKGVLLPAAMLLLLIVCFSLFATTAAYQSKYRTYDSLELSNISATMKKMNSFNLVQQKSFTSIRDEVGVGESLPIVEHPNDY
ncbi:hypothetical protein [Bacillus sp. FJAT-22090]|uniref:hypothetical protein n=1 Tax=Bacillus sp. FJAT-22090 TaxID=1581038 RepID=UPI00119F4C6E|nr:hypothetical protein [Bacillus sp. FJAT-22090]